MPTRSVWIAVDLATGAVGTAAPEDFGLRPAQIPQGQIIGSLQSGRLVLHGRRSVDILVVRSGEEAAAWATHVYDAAGTDADHEPDGSVATTLAALEGLSGEEPDLVHLTPGDVVALIDRHTMEYAVVRIAAD